MSASAEELASMFNERFPSNSEPAATPATDASAGEVARIVHHAVGQAKRLLSVPEAGLVNAVLRKLAAELAGGPPPRLSPAATVAEYFSHPRWLVERWFARFGADATRRLLEWNQRPAVVHLRWRSGEGDPAPDWLRPTSWPGFFEVPPGRWGEVEPLLDAGRAYVQDPSTRLAVELLDAAPGETVLDVCASPGGKSVHLADRMGRGRLFALDLPGARIDRLRENLARVSGVETRIVPADLLRGVGERLKAAGAPATFPAVMLDVPCSNTGVMRHRIDVKWRLRSEDFSRHARQQRRMLAEAARLVAPGGRLVYSTCSIDADENEGVVAAFLEKEGARFGLDSRILALPWECGHDGAAAFLLRLRE